MGILIGVPFFCCRLMRMKNDSKMCSSTQPKSLYYAPDKERRQNRIREMYEAADEAATVSGWHAVRRDGGREMKEFLPQSNAVYLTASPHWGRAHCMRALRKEQ